jgi:hypothetical protein
MANVGGWAQSWDDILWYLEVVAPHNNEFSRTDEQALIGYIQQLMRNGARFTTDFREVYQQLTGVPCQDPPLPENALLRLHLRKVATKWLEGLHFPASKEDVLERAKANHAPPELIQLLRQLEKPRYPSMGALLQRLCDKARGRG